MSTDTLTIKRSELAAKVAERDRLIRAVLALVRARGHEHGVVAVVLKDDVSYITVDVDLNRGVVEVIEQ